MRIHLTSLRALLTRSWKAVALVAVGALAGGTVLAVASVPDSNGVVHVCYLVTSPTNGEPPVPISGAANMIVIDPSAGQSCNDREQALTLDQTGIQGAQGATGPTGPEGSPGSVGAPGVQGLAGLSATALAIPTSVGQVTLKRAVQGKVGGGTPSEISFAPLSVTLNDKSKKGSLTITKLLDSSTPSLLQAMASASVFPSGSIVLDGSNSTSTRYKLTSVVITSSKLEGTESTKTQSLTLKYQKIEISK